MPATRLAPLLLAIGIGVGIGVGMNFNSSHLFDGWTSQKVKSVPTPGTRPAAAATTHTVTMDGTTFKPSSMTIALDDSVVWKNEDPFPHTATATGGAFDSKPLAPGGSFTFRPPAKGDFPYKCSLHPTMRGILHVQ